MACISSITTLIDKWNSRVADYPCDDEYSTGYRDALIDCLYELNEFINTTIEKEMLECMPADDFINLQLSKPVKSITY